VPPNHPPASSDERVQCNVAGHVVPKLKTPCRDNITHQAMPLLEFI